jgi:hypothetical protein
MAAPAWLSGVFAAVMLTVAVYCAGRLVAARRWRRPTEVDTDAGHVLMGVAMAGMLVARLRVFPDAAWEVVFAAGAAWYAWRLFRSRRSAEASPWRCLQPTPHLAECAAMLYMFGVLSPSLASRAASGMAAMSASVPASRFSFLGLLLALFMFGYVVRVADRLSPRALRAAGPAAALGLVSPGASVGRVDSVASVVPAGSVVAAGSVASAGPLAFAGSLGSAGPLGSADPVSAVSPAGPRPGSVGSRPAPGGFLAPRCAALCKIAMGLTMGYMLILML